jgi:hypothetical protein
MKLCNLSRPDDIRIDIKANPRYSSESRQSVEEIQLEYHCRRKFRQNKLSQIKAILEEQTQGRVRRQQGVFLYFLNLLLPLTVSCLIAYVFLSLYENR